METKAEVKNLPPINTVVLAKCQRIDGSIEEHEIRRITSKDYAKGWQWSHPEVRTYFTLKVLSWELGFKPKMGQNVRFKL